MLGLSVSSIFSYPESRQSEKLMSKKKKILFVVDLLSGRGGGGECYPAAYSTVKFRSSGIQRLFILNDGGRYASRTWCEGIVWGESQRITGNHKISRLFHVLQLAFFMLKNRPNRVVVLNTIPCLITRRATENISYERKIINLMHSQPPRDRYRPRYPLPAEHHFSISRDIARQFIELGAAPESIDVVFNPVKVPRLSRACKH